MVTKASLIDQIYRPILYMRMDMIVRAFCSMCIVADILVDVHTAIHTLAYKDVYVHVCTLI